MAATRWTTLPALPPRPAVGTNDRGFLHACGQRQTTYATGIVDLDLVPVARRHPRPFRAGAGGLARGPTASVAGSDHRGRHRPVPRLRQRHAAPASPTPPWLWTTSTPPGCPIRRSTTSAAESSRNRQATAAGPATRLWVRRLLLVGAERLSERGWTRIHGASGRRPCGWRKAGSSASSVGRSRHLRPHETTQMRVFSHPAQPHPLNPHRASRGLAN